MCGSNGNDCDRDLHKSQSEHVRQPIGGATTATNIETPASVSSAVVSNSNSGAVEEECDLCAEFPATVFCKECDLKLCDENGNNCDRDFHKSKPNHIRTALNSSSKSKKVSSASDKAKTKQSKPKKTITTSAPAPVATEIPTPNGEPENCDLCGEFPVVVYCSVCNFKLCGSEGHNCDGDIHKNKPNHIRTRISNTGFSSSTNNKAPSQSTNNNQASQNSSSSSTVSQAKRSSKNNKKQSSQTASGNHATKTAKLQLTRKEIKALLAFRKSHPVSPVRTRSGHGRDRRSSTASLEDALNSTLSPAVDRTKDSSKPSSSATKHITTDSGLEALLERLRVSSPAKSTSKASKTSKTSAAVKASGGGGGGLGGLPAPITPAASSSPGRHRRGNGNGTPQQLYFADDEEHVPAKWLQDKVE